MIRGIQNMRAKRIIAFSLIICMAALFNGIAFTATTDIPGTDQSINNQIELPRVVQGNDIYSQKNYNISTEYDGIKKSADGYFVMSIKTDEGTQMIPVGKVDINLANENDVARVLNNDNIALEIKERVAFRHKQVTEKGYAIANATLFSPELLPKNNAIGPGYSL